jgi:hypothetical protein
VAEGVRKRLLARLRKDGIALAFRNAEQ